jgi:hypothetical protein
MRFSALIFACAGIGLMVAGCDPVTERRYFTEGAGVDLYTADRANQVELQSRYIDFICKQSGSDCGGNWTTFVHAGMNDIDQRCDGFLSWLDAQRRDKEPVLAELSALNTAAHAIMTVTGSSPKSLDIVTAAFGLASASYTNWNSRLLISVNQSTVQQVVYKGQGDFRDKIKTYAVPDQSTAIYLLRNYLRLCMPTTIEASINTTTTLVLSDVPAAVARENLVVSTTTPRTLVIAHPSVDTSYRTLRAQLFPAGARTADPAIVAYVREILGPPPIAIGVILNNPDEARLRQKISACIVARGAGQPCAPASLASSRR